MKRSIVFAIALLTLVGVVAFSFVRVRAFAQEAGPTTEEGPDDDGMDQPITGSALEKASKEALSYVGEGRVTETEVGDEEGYYEVEITLPNGQQVDVHLDENFVVLSKEADSEND